VTDRGDGEECAGIPPVLRRFWVLLAGLTALSLAFTLIMTYAMGWPYPYGLPLFHPGEHFRDFTIFDARFEHFRTAMFWDPAQYPFTYPAPVAVVFGLLHAISAHALELYLAVVALAFAGGGVLFARALARRGIRPLVAYAFVATLGLTDWPFGLMFNQANMEGVVALALAVGVVAILRERFWLGAALVGVAGAMKLFPLVLLALLLSKRRYREFAWGFLVAGLTTLGSLWWVGPSIANAQGHIAEGLDYFQRSYVLRLDLADSGLDHSWFVLEKAGILAAYFVRAIVKHQDMDLTMFLHREAGHLGAALQLYLVAVAVLGVTLYFVWIRSLPMLNQALALTVCAVLMPPASFDYTLVHLLLPVALLCLYAVERWRLGEAPAGLRRCFFWLAVVLTMDAFFTAEVRYAGQVRSMALTAVLITALCHPWPSRSLGVGPRTTGAVG
jgi:hypothetical protein